VGKGKSAPGREGYQGVPIKPMGAHQRRRERGQSLVEFTIFLPILLFMMLIAADFGRVYLGWINLQQMARLAANYAADHATAWPGDAEAQDRYHQMVINEAALTNCELVDNVVPDPIFEYASNPRPTGSDVTVAFDCEFSLITPFIGNILGNTITASASSTFPVKEGVVVEGDASGGDGTTQAPVAEFVGSPRSGWGPVQVTFTDLSSNAPGSWSWNFSVSPGGTGSGSTSPSSSTQTGPIAVTYDCAGSPGDTCTFGVSLRVSNTAGTNTLTRDDYITVTVPPDSGPIFDFSASPQSGDEPLTTSFQYVDLGGTTPATWAWDLDGNGTTDATTQNPSHTYATEGEYTVSLTVSDGTDANTLTKSAFIRVDAPVCTVPDFANVAVNNAQGIWTSAGFTGTLTAIRPPNSNYTIKSQSLLGGTVDPKPEGCASNITVGSKP
jgi:PKD repeat protein